MPIRHLLLMSSDLADDCILTRTAWTLSVGIWQTAEIGNHDQPERTVHRGVRNLPLMIAVFAHIVDSREIELTATRSTARDLKYLGMLGISEIGDLLELFFCL